MDFIISFVVTLVVTAIALIIISKIPLGVEIDNFQKALVAALVFGFLNGIAQFIDKIITLDGLLTWLLFPIVFLINIIVFGLTAKLVQGFRLRSIWSAVFGSLLLTVLTSILSRVVFGAFGVA